MCKRLKMIFITSEYICHFLLHCFRFWAFSAAVISSKQNTFKEPFDGTDMAQFNSEYFMLAFHAMKRNCTVKESSENTSRSEAVVNVIVNGGNVQRVQLHSVELGILTFCQRCSLLNSSMEKCRPKASPE